MIAALALALASCGPTTLKRTTTSDEPVKNALLNELMRDKLNPPFSQVSFLLFHSADEEANVESTAMMLPDASRDLVHAVEVLAGWTHMPGYSQQAQQVFQEYAASIREDVARFDVAVREGRLDDARTGFDEVQRKCDACHHFFRYEEPVAAPVDPRLR